MKINNVMIHRKSKEKMTDCHENFLVESFHSMLEQSNDRNNFHMSVIETNPAASSYFISDFDKLKRHTTSNAI